MKKLIAVCLALVALAGCSKPKQEALTFSKIENKNMLELHSTKYDMKDYHLIRGEVADFEYISMAESLRFFDEKGSGVIYYGYNSCPWCVRAVPELNEVAKQVDLPVYYVNAKDQVSDEIYSRLISKISSTLTKDASGQYEFYVPYVLAINQGEIVGYHLSLVDSFQMKKDDDQMNESQKQELQKIYYDLFQKSQQ